MTLVQQKTLQLVDDTFHFSDDVVTKFADTVLDAVTGVIRGTEHVSQTTADIVDTLIHDVAGEHATRFFKGMGHIAKRLCY